MKTASLEAALQGWDPGASGVQASVVGGPKVKGSFLLGAVPPVLQGPPYCTNTQGEFPGGPVARTLCFHCWGMGLIPDWANQEPTSCSVVKINK